MRRKKMLITALIVLALIALGVVIFINTPAFGKHPKGKRLARVQASPHYKNGAFDNLEPTQTMTGDKNIAEMLWETLFKKHPDVKPHTPFPLVKTDLATLPTDKDFYLWFGHSSKILCGVETLPF